MDPSATVTIGDSDDDSTRAEEDCLCLVIAWSATQPERIGEVAFFDEKGLKVLGRGAPSRPAEAVVFYRQRPGSLEPGGDLDGPGISRRQLGLRRRGATLLLEQLGRCPVSVGGEVVERTAVEPGDTILLKSQMLLLCTKRPRRLPALRHFKEASKGAFGAADEAGIVGESPAAWRLRDQLAFAAEGRGHALVTGASGSGKELAANAIHSLSARSKGPFVARNAATFPAELVDAELFGTAKGYPNANMPERIGLIGEADGGTLFLDEVGDLPERLQAHLLRVLDRNGEYQRLGESRSRRADLRVVGATNRDLGLLRTDLTARFAMRVALPSLADRREDIPLLVQSLLERIARESPALISRFRDTAGRFRLDAALVEALLKAELATNVRALDAALWRSIESSEGDRLQSTDAVRALWGVAPARVPSVPLEPASDLEEDGDEDEPDEPEESSEQSEPSAVGAAGSPREAGGPAAWIPKSMAEIEERKRILGALEKYGGNASQAAIELGISRRTIVTRIAEYGIPRPRKKPT